MRNSSIEDFRDWISVTTSDLEMLGNLVNGDVGFINGKINLTVDSFKFNGDKLDEVIGGLRLIRNKVDLKEKQVDGFFDEAR